ncbi:MAG: amino acid permease [Candidatus Bathyarchaeota archaeon]|nr:amino acid permease [Candidatus Bathyarchaeota archaeon]
MADSNSPLKEAIRIIKNPAAEYFVSLGGLLATASVLLTSILGVSRIAYAMARKEDLPKALSKLHKKYATPYYSILIIGALMTLLVLSIDLTSVVAISTFALLFYYSLANLSALRLNVNEKISKVYPRIGALTCFVLLVFILLVSPQSWMMGTASLLIGAVFYAAKQRIS